MTLRLSQIDIPVSSLRRAGLTGRDVDGLVRSYVLEKLAIDESDVVALHINKKSLDARHKHNIIYRFQADVDVRDEERIFKRNQSIATRIERPKKSHPLDEVVGKKIEFRHRPVVVGSGPAGIFTALMLAEAGHAPIIIERGQPVETRMRDVHKFRRSGDFTPESNYCFGEGGAGTFSDGKLSSGKNHPLIEFLFEQWVRFGAPAEILYDAKPHIGTDYLMQISRNMRLFLEEAGATFMFGRRMDDWEAGDSRARHYITLDNGDRLATDHLVLAIGHSARDTYKMLHARGLYMAPKPFAMGARFEHPQEVIDEIQFGSCEILPPAEYKLVTHAPQDRGIWTFCMCPGGHLLPTSAQPEHLAINGMSYHARQSGFANAAVVVNVRREDFFKGDIFDGMHLQEQIEKLAFQEGGGSYFSPAQRLQDFLAGRQSQGELNSTYKPGVKSARLDRILPEFIVDSLQFALHEYNRKMKGYLSEQALVVGVETKTSSPIVMTRDKNFHSVSHQGFFPTGEGAGFAGGIVSAALDGVRVGQAVLNDAITQPTSTILACH